MRLGILLAGAALAALGAVAANAALVVTVAESGADVVATVSGTLDLTGMGVLTSGSIGRFENANSGLLLMGTGNFVNVYSMTGGPSSFGPSSNSYSADGPYSGQSFGVINGQLLYLDGLYTSGSAFSSSMSWTNQSLASLGLNTGQFNYTAGSNAITVNIGAAAAVPEISTWAMMVVGFGAVGFALRSRRTVAVRFT